MKVHSEYIDVNHPSYTDGNQHFAECLRHSAKPKIHSAKALLSAALSKGHSAKN